MELMQAIRTRRSIRSFQNKPIEDEKLRAVLDAGRLAPSAGNRQEWRFVAVRDPKKRAQLVEAANNQKFVGEAPVILVACAETDAHLMSCGEPCYPIDIAIALDHITLKAVEEGLGTCWIGAFNQAAVKEILGIPESIRVVELMPLGYPADQPAARPRLALEDIVRYDRW